VATCGAFGLQSGERGSDRSRHPEAEETEARKAGSLAAEITDFASLPVPSCDQCGEGGLRAVLQHAGLRTPESPAASLSRVGRVDLEHERPLVAELRACLKTTSPENNKKSSKTPSLYT